MLSCDGPMQSCGKELLYSAMERDTRLWMAAADIQP